VTAHASNLALLGGELCLDFVNTVESRGADHSQEFLVTYSDLVAWSRHVGVLTAVEAECLLHEATARQAEAEAVHRRAIALRETLYKVFLSIVEGQPAEVRDLEQLNAALAPALSRLRIVPLQVGFAWDWHVQDGDLDRMLCPIVRSTAELLANGPLDRLKQCAGCGWLFLDGSRNRTRRWCDMRVCGNRAKARRHYERQREREGG
jgi:predicted RNA-binding Zn ribbon-like protein